MKVWRILAWIFIPFIMIFIEWKKIGKIARVIGTIWAIVAFSQVINALSGNTEQADTNKSTTTVTAGVNTNEAKQKPEEEKPVEVTVKEETKKDEKPSTPVKPAKTEEDNTKKYQEAVLQFEKEMYAIEETMKPYMDNYQNALNGVSQGTVDFFTAYEATEEARDAAKNIQSQYYQMKIAKDLPKDVKKELEDAKSDLATAYYTKSEALEYVLKYFDDQKPSYMSKFQDEISMSDNFIMSGVLKVFKAKELVGIELTE